MGIKKIVYKKIEDIIPYGNNPRTNDEAVEYVANSIKEFNFQNPIIIDDSNIIVTGHTRLKAAKKLGLKEVPCILADDLTPNQIKKFRLADNKVAEIAEWDLDLLDLELADLDGMGDFGFEKLDKEFNGMTDEDAIPENVETICKRGQIWQLGNHRLMCGDSTIKEDVEKLMNGEKAELIKHGTT